MSDTYNIGPTVPGLFAAHESRFKEAADEIDRLRATLENLLKYAWHKFDCEKRCIPIGYHSCTCGYDALIAELEESK